MAIAIECGKFSEREMCRALGSAESGVNLYLKSGWKEVREGFREARLSIEGKSI